MIPLSSLLLLLFPLLLLLTPLSSLSSSPLDRCADYTPSSPYDSSCFFPTHPHMPRHALESLDTTLAPFPSPSPSPTLVTPTLLHMWTTPIMSFPLPLPPSFSISLHHDILRLYKSFRLHSPQYFHVSSASSNSLNQKFFEWQVERKGKGNGKGKNSELFHTESQSFFSSPSMVKLFDMMISSAKHYYESIGIKQNVIDKRMKSFSSSPSDPIWNRFRSLSCWATVNHDGMFHLPHTHPHESLSMVFYTFIPQNNNKINEDEHDNSPSPRESDGEGILIFDDPRGPLPPFEGKYFHYPKQGELILFPSWVQHQVTPTYSHYDSQHKGNDDHIDDVGQWENVRTSIACNLDGQWEDTTDVSILSSGGKREDGKGKL